MRILLLGANGQVGKSIVDEFKHTNEHAIIALTRVELDLSDLENILLDLEKHIVDLVINAAAYTAVDKAEDEEELAHRINFHAVEKIAFYCKMKNIPLIHFSTDYVFDGTKTTAYHEDDIPNPLSVYGQSKLKGEKAAFDLLTNVIVLRVCWIFSLYGKNFVKTIVNAASTRKELNVVNDQWGCPTAARDIARVVLAMVNIISKPNFNAWGIYHYAAQKKTNWYEFTKMIVQRLKLQNKGNMLQKIQPISSAGYPTKAKRPPNSVLAIDKIMRVFNINPHLWIDYLPEVIESCE